MSGLYFIGYFIFKPFPAFQYKDGIIEEANKELELFKKFQIAAQANPKLTYVDFCNNIKNKEV